MVHSRTHQHVKITYKDGKTGDIGYLNPGVSQILQRFGTNVLVFSMTRVSVEGVHSQPQMERPRGHAEAVRHLPQPAAAPLQHLRASALL